MSAIIECRGLSKRYGNKQALKNIDFEVHAGQPIALVGPNGAGKSTLFGILAGYINASSGDARISGYPVGHKDLLGRIGCLPQDALFDPKLSIIQQLSYFSRLQGFGKAASLREADRVLELMKLTDIGREKINQLSHGMKKRVAIAQALMGEPDLVLLDEPTAGLDPENARNIRHQVTELAGDITFIVSSHNLAELERMCAQVLYLEQGELKALQTINGDDLDADSLADTQSKKVDFLTVRLQQKNSQIISRIEQLSSVLNIDMKQEDEFIIHYDRQLNPILDQELLKLLAVECVAYRQITQGQSLEDQLFSASSKSLSSSAL